MKISNTVNDYLNRCIDAAISLKKHFPEQKTRYFWMGFNEAFPERKRVSAKMIADITKTLEQRKVTCNPPLGITGLSFGIDLSQVVMTPEQAKHDI